MLRRIEKSPVEGLLALCVVVLIMFLWFVEWDMWRVLGVGIMSLIVLLVYVSLFPMLSHDLRLQYETGKKTIEDIKTAFLSQSAVDKRLTELAADFNSVCQKQVKLQGHEMAEAELEDLARGVAQAKARFWAARAVATQLDFVVKASVKDYLKDFL